MKIMMVLILYVVPIFSIENKVLAKQVVHDILWPFFPALWGECPVKQALCMIMMMRMMAIKKCMCKGITSCTIPKAETRNRKAWKNWNWVQRANYMPTI